ncbi:hypothetical protein ACRALDRAFT_1094232, partial [Sodiomyces alcalophilus JCM 7366]|uniref:uncharacterized protein n=1 Tax=Sodiomyces alcalophilus JCM 7366 TaxID=591952 RepID=UPI0039B5545F
MVRIRSKPHCWVPDSDTGDAYNVVTQFSSKPSTYFVLDEQVYVEMVLVAYLGILPEATSSDYKATILHLHTTTTTYNHDFILPLPDDVVRQIKSSVVITSLNDAVLGLIKNALDASATKINVSVEYARGNCSAEDDGLGIPPDEFRESGGLGKYHYTSRYPPTDHVYGSHGAFLSSLATLSLTSITSHHHEHRSHNTITMHHGKVLARNTPALPEHRLRSLSSEHGTRVVVRDLFGLMPVRVKQRPLATDKTSLDREFSRLVRSAVAIVLAWPRPVAISLRDGITGNQVRLRPSSSPPSDSHVRSDADATLVTRVSTSLVQAGLADDLSYSTWVPVAASAGNVSVRGCVSLNAVATRRAQFISLGIHPLHNDYGLNVLYDQVNRVFSHSAFSAEEDQDDADGGPKDKYAARQLRTKRTLDRWPMFYFCVELSSKQKAARLLPSLDETLDRPHTLSGITDLLRLVCFEFLKKYHFRPRSLVRDTRSTKKDVSKSLQTTEAAKQRGASAAAPSKRKHSRSMTPVATASRRPESPFDLWQRVKVGKARQARSPRKCVTGGLPEKPEPPLIDDDGRLLRQPFDEVDPPEASATKEGNEESRDAADGTRTSRYRSSPSEIATTPTTGPSTGETQRDASSASASSREHGPQKRIRLMETTTAESEPSEWVKKVISTWENPVFPAVDPPVPRIGDATTTPGGDAKDFARACAGGVSFDPSIVRLGKKLSRDALRRAQVIAQVDRKFLLVRFPSETRSLLVLVDQHAADERCRLEVLMRDYFVNSDGAGARARTETLETPLAFEFDAQECELLRRYSEYWSHWGVVYQVRPTDAQRPPRQPEDEPRRRHGLVDVRSLPPSILERSCAEPRLLVALLRNEIWRLEDEGGAPAYPASRDVRDAADWVTNFQGCPQGILDMLHSRSCRSAIMFNDELSPEECADLLRRLGRCVFPFQCAHGRPSMVPLVDLRSLSCVFRGGETTERVGFGKMLRQSGITSVEEDIQRMWIEHDTQSRSLYFIVLLVPILRYILMIHFSLLTTVPVNDTLEAPTASFGSPKPASLPTPNLDLDLDLPTPILQPPISNLLH